MAQSVRERAITETYVTRLYQEPVFTQTGTHLGVPGGGREWVEGEEGGEWVDESGCGGDAQTENMSWGVNDIYVRGSAVDWLQHTLFQEMQTIQTFE